MCKYCYMMPNGDIPDDRESLIVEDIPFNYEETIHIDCQEDEVGAYGDYTVKIKDEFRLIMDVSKGYLYYAIFDKIEDPDIGLFLDHEGETSIKYCPMCGRKLGEG